MTVLLLGVPGIGKTTALDALGQQLQCSLPELSLIPEPLVIAGVGRNTVVLYRCICHRLR